MTRGEMGRENLLLQAWTIASQKAVRAQELRVAEIAASYRPVNASVLVDGRHGILIVIRPGERVKIPSAFRGDSPGALRAEIAQYSAGNGAENALHIWCVDFQCSEAFTSFCAILIDRLESADLSQLLDDCYREFQRLVGTKSIASRSKITGLLGELLVLRDAVSINAAAIDFWAGPRGERHDFRRSAIAVEVKATRRSESKTRRVRISDWDQLEIPEQGRLYLHWVQLEQCAGGEVAIPRLIADIRVLLDAPQGKVFDEFFENFEREIVNYPEEFAILARETYSVQPGFPRLVPRSLSSEAKLHGVSAVSYDLDLDQAAEYRSDWQAALFDLVGGV